MGGWIIAGLLTGLVGGILVAGMVLYVIFRKVGKRKEEMESAALRLGFEFETRGGSIASSEFAKLPLLKNGIGIRSPNLKEQCENILHGTRGSMELTMFDFRYSTGGGAGRKVTAVAFRFRENLFPAFEVKPRSLLSMRIAGKDESIGFDSDPVFSKSYLLMGKDESAIRTLFSPDIRQVLLETGKKWAAEAHGNKLLVYLQSQQAAPEKLVEFMDTACRITDVLLSGSEERS